LRPHFLTHGALRIINTTDGLARVVIESLTYLFLESILFVIIYFGIGLRGSYGYIFAVQFLTLMVSVAIGSFLGCTTKDPRSAKELIPIVLLSNLLLSGYFVNSADLPDYIAWAQWLVPLPYAFRLFLYEEFQMCLNPTDDLDFGGSATARFCHEYLENQDATGENNLRHWMVLLGMFAGFRVLALALIYQKATQK